MGKSILVISSSLRVTSNSAILAHEIVRGALDAGNDAEFLSLAEKDLNFCTGCMACQKTHRCVINDDATLIAEKVQCADVLVFVSPIYYYEMSGQLKTMLDRMNPLYGSDYRFRDVYFVCTAADDDETTPDRAVSGIEGWIACFDKATFRGKLFCGGVNEPGEIMSRSKCMEKAYLLGSRL
ncbi:MAG: flavodoxin family protein [Oscillospiraceae bacterium]|nr:flavodoxin family protein [Oscillospiraceae bacterium]